MQTVSGLNTYIVLNAGVVVLTENSLKAIDNILIEKGGLNNGNYY